MNVIDPLRFLGSRQRFGKAAFEQSITQELDMVLLHNWCLRQESSQLRIAETKSSEPVFFREYLPTTSWLLDAGVPVNSLVSTRRK